MPILESYGKDQLLSQRPKDQGRNTNLYVFQLQWNSDKQRASKSFTGSLEINVLLGKVAEEVNKAYRNAISQNKPITNEYLKECLDRSVNPEANRDNTFFGYFDEYIRLQKPTKTKASIQKYNALKKHLLEFQAKKRFTILFEKIDADFCERFISFLLSDLQLLNNTASKYIRTLKTFMNWSTEREYNTSLKFRSFKTTQRESEVVSLSHKELFALYELDLNNNLSLDRVRDVFCFACFTGLRYSDLIREKKDTIKKDELHLVSEKTTELLVVPLIPFAKDILLKYKYHLPFISNQKMNDYLKELGKLAEIDEIVQITQFRGSEEIKTKFKKYELLSTHFARKTFVTLSLEKGMRVETLMNITGHKKYSTLQRYISITNKLKVVEMNNVWGNKRLKVI